MVEGTTDERKQKKKKKKNRNLKIVFFGILTIEILKLEMCSLF